MNKPLSGKIFAAGMALWMGMGICFAQTVPAKLDQHTQQAGEAEVSKDTGAAVENEPSKEPVSKAPEGKSTGASMGDEDSKIRIKSDGDLTMFYGEKYAIFNTNVVVSDKQGPMLKCQRLSVFFKDQSNIERMVAEKDVVIFHEDVRGNCQRAEYVVATDIATMTGDPMIKKGMDQYAADKITIFRKKGNILFEPAARLVVFPDEEPAEANAESTDETDATDDAQAQDPASEESAEQTGVEEQEGTGKTTFVDAEQLSEQSEQSDGELPEGKALAESVSEPDVDKKTAQPVSYPLVGSDFGETVQDREDDSADY